jgi:hypothetical protein
MARSKLDRAKAIVERRGIALVYPIANEPEPPSLWADLFRNAPMHWAWDDDADPRVADVWHLRRELMETHDVAYAKWFRGRATFFALPVFHAMLGRLGRAGDPEAGLPHEAREILGILRERSPMSTKELRAAADLRGKAHEALYAHAMKALWARLLVVGTGEIDDGAFPSLAVAATELVFEDIFAARHRVPPEADARLAAALASRGFARELARSLSAMVTGEEEI